MKRKGYENSAQRRVLIEMGSVQIEGLRCLTKFKDIQAFIGIYVNPYACH